MARLLSQTLTRPNSISPFCLSQRRRSIRTLKSSQIIEIDLDSDSGNSDVELIGIKKLEDVIHGIVVKRLAPDWLPFIPGSSYWVPPRRRPHGIMEAISRLSGQHPSMLLSAEESLSLTTVRGWPSSAYFIEGTTSAHQLPVEMDVEMKVHTNAENESSQVEEEEG